MPRKQLRPRDIAQRTRFQGWGLQIVRQRQRLPKRCLRLCDFIEIHQADAAVRVDRKQKPLIAFVNIRRLIEISQGALKIARFLIQETDADDGDRAAARLANVPENVMRLLVGCESARHIGFGQSQAAPRQQEIAVQFCRLGRFRNQRERVFDQRLGTGRVVQPQIGFPLQPLRGCHGRVSARRREVISDPLGRPRTINRDQGVAKHLRFGIRHQRIIANVPLCRSLGECRSSKPARAKRDQEQHHDPTEHQVPHGTTPVRTVLKFALIRQK
ncbi:hypothetical protein D9M73_113460 [compost metagenome]